MSKKALLMILDGWGIGDQGKDDVIFNTPTPYWDSLLANYPHSELQASGENVGLPDGQMGNSEVGHLNIGAGRIVYQDLVKINRACADNSIMKNPEIVSAFSYAKENGKNIHFMGLTSNGGVHSSFDHLFKLCDISKEYGIENTFIHCFMDGRDTDPKSGKGFIEQLTAHCEKSAGKIASIVGRFYAMDRDKRWERVKEAYDLLVEGKGKQAADMVQAMQESYDEGVTDEFIKPINNSTVDGTIKEGDVVIFFNYRNDRAKELTVVLTQQDMPEQGMHTIPGLQFYCMTPYDASFKGVHILFDKENVQNTLGEYLAANGKTQLHIAETEKYAHVTFFFNGGRETPYDAEERILDIGTGSGCIPVSLAQLLPEAQVSSCDVSAEALRIAAMNVKRYGDKVTLFCADILKEELPECQVDVLVSNPPYITESERMDMEANVLDWEPELALFVPDSDPLRFYRRIARKGLDWLSEGGALYFEINRAYGAETVWMLEELGYCQIELRKDLSGNDRMIKAIRP